MTATLPREDCARAAAAMDRLFAGRRDKHLKYRFSTGKGQWLDEPLSLAVWEQHLAGRDVIGVAPLVRDGDRTVCKWACVDIDQDATEGLAEQMAIHLCQHLTLTLEMTPWVERTKGGQIHVWLFFADWIDAWKIRAILHRAFAFLGWKDRGGKKGSETAIHPASDTLPDGGTSTGVYVPLSAHFSATERQVFVDWKNGAIYSDQLDVLEGIRPLDADVIDHHIKAMGITPPNVHRLPSAGGVPVSEKAPAGSIPALTDEEFGNLCAKLPSLRSLADQPCSASYKDWFSGVLHLVPFADGSVRAHALSALDAARYDATVCDKQYNAAVKMYEDNGRQPEPRVSQLIVTHWRGGGRTDIVPISRQYCVWNGGYAKRIIKEGVEQEPMRLTNFTVQIIAEEHQDDGIGGIVRRIRLRGMMAGGSPLGECAIDAQDWNNLKLWLPRAWGMRPVIYKDDAKSGGVGEVLRVISLQHQDAVERKLFTHTGWCRAPGSGNPVYVLAQGPVAGSPEDMEAMADECDVSVSKEISMYRLPTEVTDEEVERGFGWIEAFLECAQKRATAPLVAMHFLAPLYTWLRPNIALWIAGRSGAQKSSLVAAIGNLWGDDWEFDNLPATWSSSAKGILRLGFEAKDLPFVVDNFVPDKERKEHAKQREVSHQIGDHSSRSKLSSSSRVMTATPVRGLIIATGEDAPEGEGASNRWYNVSMMQGDCRSMAMEEVQLAGRRGELAPAMTHYLRWLAEKLRDAGFVKRVRDYFLQLEKEGRVQGAAHMRLPSQTAWVKVGLALCKAAHPRKAWNSSVLDREIDVALSESAIMRNAQSQESRLSYRFLSAIQYLIHTGVIHGIAAETGGVPDYDPRVFGWRPTSPVERRDPECPSWRRVHGHSRAALWIIREGVSWWVAIDPNEMVTLVKETIRTGNPINESRLGIANNLLSDKLMDEGSEGRKTLKHKYAGMEGRRGMWLLHGPTYLRILGEAPDTAAEPPPTPDAPSGSVD